MKNSVAFFVVSIENLNILKCHAFSKKTLALSTICSKYENKRWKIFKEEESTDINGLIGKM